MDNGELYLVASAVCLLVGVALAAVTVTIELWQNGRPARPPRRQRKWHECRRQDNGE